jgi:hypothetical protein
MLIPISIALFALIVASIVYLFVRDQELINGVKAFIKAGKYTPRAQPPIAAPFVYEPLSKIACYDGQIKPNLPCTLILGIRATGEGKNKILYYYIGFYFPSQVKFSDEWLNGWQTKVAERGDHWAEISSAQKIETNWGVKGAPDTLPIRAEREGGGVFLAWNGLHTRDCIQARIDDILASLDISGN